MELEVLPCGTLFEKRIEILLSHIRDKNKFKNRDSIFLLVQCFKTFPLSHTNKTLYMDDCSPLLIVVSLEREIVGALKIRRDQYQT